MSDPIISPEFRASYVHLVTPHKIDPKDPDEVGKFDLTIVLPKGEPEAEKFIKRVRAAIDEAMIEKFGKPTKEAAMKHYPIKDGDAREDEDHAGMWLITARNKFKPSCVDANGQKLFNEEQLYSGAWYRVGISCYAWDSGKGGKGCSINLDAVLKVRDDDRFGGGANAATVFASFIDDGCDQPSEADAPPARPNKGKSGIKRTSFLD